MLFNQTNLIFSFVVEEQQDTIFVSGIAENTTEDDLKDYFGAIGLIKVCLSEKDLNDH